jgi:membrane protease YdiL (CAAX protease family)
MVFPSVMTWVYFVAVADKGTGQNTAVMAGYGLGKFIQFAFPALYVAWTARQLLRPARPNRQGLAAGMGFGLAVGLAALALYFFALKHSRLLHDTPQKVYEKLQQLGCDSIAGFIVIATFISLFHSLLEEYYWRWFVFGWWKRYLRPRPAGVLSSLGFMAHHVIVLAVYFPGVQKFFTMVVPFSLGVAIGGGVWCWLYQRTGSLYAAWISHALIDCAIMLIGLDMVADRFAS